MIAMLCNTGSRGRTLPTTVKESFNAPLRFSKTLPIVHKLRHREQMP